MTALAASTADPPGLASYCLEEVRCRPERAVAGRPGDHAWTEPLLRENAIWFCQLRWLVVAVLGTVALAGAIPGFAPLLGLRIQPAWPGGAAVLLALANLVFVRVLGRVAGAPAQGATDAPPGTPATAATTGGTSMRAILWAQIVTDLLILTAVIHWLGPGWPAAAFMYLFHIILACLVFPPAESLAVAGIAAASHGVALWVVAAGWVPASGVLLHGASLEVPAGVLPLTVRVVPMLLVWGVIWYLVSRLAGTLRRRELELAETNRRLAASSEERANHMLQTTHQLKAPFAAIHAMTQVLLGGYAGTLPAPAVEVVGKISVRCLALSRQIQEMLQLANLRSRGQTDPRRVHLDLAAVVGDALGRVEPAARQRQIRLESALAPAPVTAVADHLTMLVDNLVVNAVAYSRDGGRVEVACAPVPEGGTELRVQDHGIGIPREKLPRIFDDYYRTEEAVQHNRASTGLGLAIVRQVACAERARVCVDSAPGWGTRFTVRFPPTDPDRSHNPPLNSSD